MTENFKVETFEGIRYKIFLTEKVTPENSGVSKIHIERVPNSSVFEKMTTEELKKYVGDAIRASLHRWAISDLMGLDTDLKGLGK